MAGENCSPIRTDGMLTLRVEPSADRAAGDVDVVNDVAGFWRRDVSANTVGEFVVRCPLVEVNALSTILNPGDALTVDSTPALSLDSQEVDFGIVHDAVSGTDTRMRVVMGQHSVATGVSSSVKSAPARIEGFVFGPEDGVPTGSIFSDPLTIPAPVNAATVDSQKQGSIDWPTVPLVSLESDGGVLSNVAGNAVTVAEGTYIVGVSVRNIWTLTATSSQRLSIQALLEWDNSGTWEELGATFAPYARNAPAGGRPNTPGARGAANRRWDGRRSFAEVGLWAVVYIPPGGRRVRFRMARGFSFQPQTAGANADERRHFPVAISNDFTPAGYYCEVNEIGFFPLGGVSQPRPPGRTPSGRVERITFQAVASASSDTEAVPIATSPLSVSYGSGGNEILSDVTGNDFTVQPGLYGVDMEAEATGGHARSTLGFQIRDAADDSNLAHSTRPTIANTGANTLHVSSKAFLWLTVPTVVNVHLERQQESGTQGTWTIDFIRVGGPVQ